MRFLFTAFLLSITSLVFSQNEGIIWIEQDLNKALELAKSSDKMVHVYGYTTWCGPCKMMKKKVFPTKEVGDFYNDKFINVMVDLEKGEGFAISEKYEVQAYPTFLWLNAKGEVIHRTMGGRDVIEFVDLGRAALDPSRQITTMRGRYESGERSPAFLKQYAQVISEAEFSGFEPITQEYLKSQSDWSKPENMKFLFDYSEATYDSELFRYTLEHKQSFIDLIGKDKVVAKLEFAADRDRSKAGIPKKDVDNLKPHYEKYFSKEKAYHMAMQSYFNEIMYSTNPIEQEAFKSEIQLYLSDKPDASWRFYNAAAWQVYQLFDDKELLKKAASWTQYSIDKQGHSYNYDTLAHILAKLGQKAEAKELALKAIELAQKEGNDPTDTQTLLNSL